VDFVGSKDNGRNERRRHRRLPLETDVSIRSGGGLVPGRSLDVSESGMSAILPFELPVGQVVELTARLSIAVATTRAVVRTRNLLRHGFEFLQPLHDIVPRGAASADCQSCGGTSFILHPVEAADGVAFTRVRCPDCGAIGRDGRPL
jgi:PilZ domain